MRYPLTHFIGPWVTLKVHMFLMGCISKTIQDKHTVTVIDTVMIVLKHG